MAKRLVIAEKPSVGNSIAAVLGLKDRKDGYIEGRGYIVSWGFGHLAELANADTYDEKYVKWYRFCIYFCPVSCCTRKFPQLFCVVGGNASGNGILYSAAGGSDCISYTGCTV